MVVAIISTTVCVGVIAVGALSPKAKTTESAFQPIAEETKVTDHEQPKLETTPEMEAALALMQKIRDGKLVSDQKDTLKDLPPVYVTALVDEELAKLVDTSSIASKFSLTLRRNNIKIESNPIATTPTLLFIIEGFWTEDNATFVYTISASVFEYHLIARKEKFIGTRAATWEISTFGIAGKNKIREALTNTTEEFAEQFSNAYLSAQ